MFWFAAMWGFGGALSSDSKCDDRKTFSQEWRKLLPSKTFKLPEQVSVLASLLWLFRDDVFTVDVPGRCRLLLKRFTDVVLDASRALSIHEIPR